MEYLRKNWAGKKATAPVLEKRHRKYFLRFSYTEEVPLTKTPVKEQIICSVDLGRGIVSKIKFFFSRPIQLCT